MSLSKKNANRFKNDVIINENTPFAVTEAFKAARTSLMFMLNSDKCKKNSIVFTSYAPMEGKSTTALNLAVTFSQIGAKVLIIDADMRKPSVDKYLGFEYKKGLSDILAGLVTDYNECIVKTKFDNLFVLPAGIIPPNPTELLISENMDNLLEKLAPVYDYIFIDSPPIGLTTDAAILGSKTEGIINIVNCNSSKAEEIEAIKSSLEQANIKLIGCIINAAETDINYKHHYYKNGYKYGYGKGGNHKNSKD